MNFDIEQIRQDFPILQRQIYNKPLVYLDNGATTQKPKLVIDAIAELYSNTNSNIHRGVHFLSNQCTDQYEEARKKIARFINAYCPREIIFTKGTTDSINMVAFSFGEAFIAEGDEIMVTEHEHHSNIVPWQMLCQRKNAVLKVIPINKHTGELNLDEYKKQLSSKTKLVAVTQVSNSLGIINPVKEITALAHQVGAKVLIDGAQAIQHLKIDVQDLDCDFYAFSGHKFYAETGIGVLYGKRNLLKAMPPYQGGGDMIDTVSFEKTTYQELPLKFEAGTNNYVGAISMLKAIEYIESIGFENIKTHEQTLFNYAIEKLTPIKGLKIIGNNHNKTSSISFILDGIHHYDAGMIMDKMGVAVRTGSHCTQPLMKALGIDGTIRASLTFYNNKSDIDRLEEAIQKTKMMFA